MGAVAVELVAGPRRDTGVLQQQARQRARETLATLGLLEQQVLCRNVLSDKTSLPALPNNPRGSCLPFSPHRRGDPLTEVRAWPGCLLGRGGPRSPPSNTVPFPL